MSITIRRKQNAKSRIDQIIGRALKLAGRHVRRRRALEHLLYLVRSRTVLLRPTNADDRYADVSTVTIVCGLLDLSRDHWDWLRPAGDWVPAAAGALPRFASLAQHLLSHYPLPVFTASAWTRGGERQQGWYKHLGLGRNIRTADIPLPLTGRMAHEFARAPDHYAIDMALRWGQVRGLGGSKELARWIVATRLGRSFEHEDFWRTVVHFFVNHPELPLDHVGPIVDYLHGQRFAAPTDLAEAVAFAAGPPQPNLSMKGRTPRSLLRQVGEWHARLSRIKRDRELRWGRSDIGDFRLPVDADGTRCWTIRELLSGDELYREGAAMRHCVASYGWKCCYWNRSIWSMQFGSDGRRYRALTIEVDKATRTIRQARRRANAPPNAKLRDIMEQWARQEGLTIEC